MALYVLMFEEIFSYLDYYRMIYKSWVSFELVWSWTRQLLGLISLSVKWNELFCYSYLLRKLFNLSLASGSMILHAYHSFWGRSRWSVFVNWMRKSSDGSLFVQNLESPNVRLSSFLLREHLVFYVYC